MRKLMTISFGRRAVARAGLTAMLTAVTLLVCSQAFAADITDVLDSADEHVYDGKVVPDYFDFDIEPTFKQTIERSKITREANCIAATSSRCDEDSIIINKELRYQRIINQLDLDFEVGIYHDLEFHVKLPIIFSDVRSWKYAKNGGSNCEFDIDPDNPKCVDPSNSTIDPTGTLEDGTDIGRARIDADAQDGGDYSTYKYFDVADDYTEGPSRNGLADITFGLEWAPFNDERYTIPDEGWGRNSGRATLLIGMDYTAPTADIAKVDNEAVGRGLHELVWRIATSKRFRFIDPYLEFKFGLPIPADTTVFKDYGGGQERVGPGPWGRITVGLEFIPWENYNPDFQQFFKIDVRGVFGFVGEGREYGPLFDALGGSDCQGLSQNQVDLGLNPNASNPECGWIAEKWANAGLSDLDKIDPYSNTRDLDHPLTEDGITSYEGYGVFGAALNFYVQPIQYVMLRAGVEMQHKQAHFITFAKAGNDVRGRGPDPDNPDNMIPTDETAKDGTVSFDDIKERNPVYNPTYDSVGRRLRAEETTVFTWSIGAAFQF